MILCLFGYGYFTDLFMFGPVSDRDGKQTVDVVGLDLMFGQIF